MKNNANHSRGIGWVRTSMLAAATALAVSSPNAKGASLSITNVVGFVTGAIVPDQAVDVPKFDPSLGELTQIQIDVTGNVRTTAKIENTDPVSRTLTFGSKATLVLLDPDQNPLVTTQPVKLFTRTFDPFDGVSDFKSPPGQFSGITTLPQTGADQKLVTLTKSGSPTLFNQFIGTPSSVGIRIRTKGGLHGAAGPLLPALTVGSIGLHAHTTGQYVVTGPDSPVEGVDFDQAILTEAGLRANIVYTYNPVGFTVSGRIWNDVDRNGLIDAGEPGLAGQTVTLLYGADPSGADGLPVSGTIPQTTDSQGRYQFAGFVPPPLFEFFYYTVQVTQPAGFTLTAGSPELSQVGSSINSTFLLDLGSRDNPNVNFGFAEPLASVGGFVWADQDQDGIKGSSESGLAGVTVVLTNSVGAVPRTTTTDATGHYLFVGIASDGNPSTKFTVTVTPPAFYLPTIDPDDGLHSPPGSGFISPNQTRFPLAVGQVSGAVDFGYAGGGQLGDRVWNDRNNNGLQEANEPGIAGVVLTATGGTKTLTTTTDGNGYYTFGQTDVLAEGTYTVTATPPPGFRQTYDLDDGWLLTAFSTPNAATVSLSLGQTRTDVDFGYFEIPLIGASIGDRVWADTNGNGLQDSGELGLAGWTVALATGSGSSATTIDTRVTDANGFYTFTDLPAGIYQVSIQNPPAHYRATVPSPSTTVLTLASDEHRDNVDFGFQPLGSIGDLVWLDANGNGTQDESPLAGVPGASVTITSAATGPLTTSVAPNGSYLFSALPPGDYDVSVHVPASYVQTHAYPGGKVTLAAGENNLTVDFGYKLNDVAVKNSALSGTVWLDENADGALQVGVEGGISGVTVSLFLNPVSANPGAIGTFTTLNNGQYFFGGLEAGSYTVVVSGLAPNLIPTYDLNDGTGPFDSPNSTDVILLENKQTDHVDFGFKPVGSVAGRVWNDANSNTQLDASEVGLPNVTVKLIDVSTSDILDQTTTAGDGSYIFANLGSGTFRVQVTPPALFGATFDIDGIATANVATVALAAGQDLANVNFGYVYRPPVGSIGDRVWNDTDNNGTQDASEPGLVGVNLALMQGTATLATTVTGPNGIYGFNNLIAGTYTVVVTPPTGYVQTFGLDGLTTGVNRATVVLASGVNRTDVDFGYGLPAPICVVPTGSITSEHWSGILGASVSQVPVNTSPSSVSGITTFEPAQNSGENYGRRIRGYIVPPSTGVYVFWVSASGNCELYLSSDENAANKQKICESITGSGFREWGHESSQKSAPRTLTAGVPYYVELLHKQELGPDHCSVGWSKPGQDKSAPSEIIPGTALAPITAPLCPPTCTGTGLTGTYYRNTSFTAPASFTRIDPTVNFNWDKGSPAAGFVYDAFSVSWNGEVEAPISGTYTFTTTSDEGVRLWVNGQELVDNWIAHTRTDNAGTITLTAGQKYSIKMEYFEGTGLAIARLRWAYPGQAIQVVPTCRLYPTASSPLKAVVIRSEAENGLHSSNGGSHNSGCAYSSLSASGGAAVGWLDNVGSYCQVSCVAPIGGTYQLKLRCSNGSRTTSVRSVYVNRVKCGTLTHPGTGDWETYNDSAPISVNLNPGNNTIRVCRDSSSQSGSIDIDYFECSK